MKKIIVITIFMLYVSFAFSQEIKSGNFRFGVLYGELRSKLPPVIETNGDENGCSSSGFGLTCTIYKPFIKIDNLHLALGGIYIGTGGSYEDKSTDDENKTYHELNIIGSYLGLRSYFGNTIGMEGEVGIGYFAHSSTTEVYEDDFDGYRIGFEQKTGISPGGIFMIGPFLNIGKVNISANLIYIGAGLEKDGNGFIISSGFRFLIGSSF